MDRVLLPLVLALAVGECSPPGSLPAPQPASANSTFNTGSLQGRVLTASDSQPVSGAQVIIAGTLSYAMTNTLGAFRIEGITPGTHRLQVRAIGLHSSDTLSVAITPMATDTVTIILGDGPFYADFDRQQAARCVDRAAARQPRSNRAADSLALVVLCTTVGVVQAAAPFAQTYCLSLAPLLPADTAFLLEHFRNEEPRLRPPSDCEPSPETRGGFLVDRDGHPAVTVGITSLTVVGNSAGSEASYYAAMLWALGWRCDYRRSGDGWRVEQCVIQWRS